jgi:abnormal spindle-like microcephaly-associated protein
VQYSLLVADVIIAQSIIRRQIASRLADKKKSSVLIMQAAARRWKANQHVQMLRRQQTRELTEHAASTAIQSFYKGHIARLMLKAQHEFATAIQSAFRGFVARLTYSMDKMDIVIVQSVVRRRLASLSAAKRKSSIPVVQMHVRKWLARCYVHRLSIQKQQDCTETAAAVLLQSIYRRHSVRQAVHNLHKSAAVVQAAFRGYFARLCFDMDMMEIILVQSIARRWLVYQQLLKQHQNAIVIQSLVRRKIALRAISDLLLAKHHHDLQNHSSTTIQRVWRGHISRLSSREHAGARKIQKTWRCFITHVDFLIQVMSIITIQARIRKLLAQSSFKKALRGILKLQAAARANSTRRRLQNATSAAIIIQSMFRAHSERSTFLIRKQASVVIQRWTRGYLSRLDMAIASFAACEIQRVWRGYSQFVDFAFSVLSAIKIQSCMRMYLSMKTCGELKLALYVEESFKNKKTVAIQRAFRHYQHRRLLVRAATTIQVAIRAYQHRRRLQMVERGTTRLQAAFRARRVRRRRPKAISHLAHRIVRANKRAKENPKQRLGFRTRSALDVLQTSTRLSEIMDAVKHLEASTRLSVVCCEVFTRVHAARILLELIGSCNRSVPHVELVHFILLTLDNVAQHGALVPSISDLESAEIFLDLMLMFRDKDGIFCLSIFLLERIADCNPAVKVSIGRYVSRLPPATC